MSLTTHPENTQRARRNILAAIFVMGALGWGRRALAQNLASSTDATPSVSGLKGTADKMQRQLADIFYTENQDYNFAILMRDMFRGEVDVAENQLANGADPVMRNAAGKVVLSRKKEIEALDRWIERFQKFN